MNIDLSGRYLVVNTESGEAIESHRRLDKAEQGALWCNEHELRCGRSPVYAVRDQNVQQVTPIVPEGSPALPPYKSKDKENL